MIKHLFVNLIKTVARTSRPCRTGKMPVPPIIFLFGGENSRGLKQGEMSALQLDDGIGGKRKRRHLKPHTHHPRKLIFWQPGETSEGCPRPIKR